MIHVAEIASLASGPGPNEDAAGAAGDGRVGAAWAIDGATGVAGREFVADAAREGGTDAAWYARRLDAAFAAEGAHDPDHAAVARRAIARVAAEWRAAVDDPEAVPRAGLPSAAAVRARWDGDRFEAAGLGDCAVLVRPDGGPARALLGAGPSAAERAFNATIGRLVREGVREASARRSVVAAGLVAARERMNRPGGYWIWSVAPEAADRLRRADAVLDRPCHVLLATDGLMRLVEVYGAYDADGLVAAAADKGLAALLRELRGIEAADAGCARFPRIKPSDDATGVLLRRG
jgi:hypothetical protein